MSQHNIPPTHSLTQSPVVPIKAQSALCIASLDTLCAREGRGFHLYIFDLRVHLGIDGSWDPFRLV